MLTCLAVFLFSKSVDSCQNGGRGSSPICEVEDKANITTRFYDIEISATDAAGNVGAVTCSVIVVPNMDNEDEIIGKKSKKGVRKLAESSSSPRALKSASKNSKSKTSKRGKGIPEVEEELRDPNALRLEYAMSTQRFVLSEATLLWDAEKNTALAAPPLPALELEMISQGGNGKSKGGDNAANKMTLCNKPVICPAEIVSGKGTKGQSKKGAKGQMMKGGTKGQSKNVGFDWTTVGKDPVEKAGFDRPTVGRGPRVKGGYFN
jgi:hypothetical protein